LKLIHAEKYRLDDGFDFNAPGRWLFIVYFSGPKTGAGNFRSIGLLARIFKLARIVG
jgi:hypothetical protein